MRRIRGCPATEAKIVRGWDVKAANYILHFVLLVFLGVSAAFAQGIIEGTVRESHGASVPNSTVALQREEGKTIFSAKTDAEGKFRFTALEAGEYTLKVDADGYYPSSVQFVLRARQPLSLSVDVDEERNSPRAGRSTGEISDD